MLFVAAAKVRHLPTQHAADVPKSEKLRESEIQKGGKGEKHPIDLPGFKGKPDAEELKGRPGHVKTESGEEKTEKQGEGGVKKLQSEGDFFRNLLHNGFLS